MNGGLTAFAIGMLGLAATAAMVKLPTSVAGEPENGATQIPARPDQPNIAAPEAKAPKPAPSVGVMVSHSSSPGPISVGIAMPPPPIVAIPRIPGPADMMVATGHGGEVRTIRSFRSNEACDEALAKVRRTISNAFCVSTTPPPPPPEHGFLIEVDTAIDDVVGLTTYPSMHACEEARSARPSRPDRQFVCTSKLH